MPAAKPIPTDNDSLDVIRAPWWCNRRRLFYVAIVALTLGGGWGSWSWWYRADFWYPPSWIVLNSSGNESLFGVSETGAYWLWSARIWLQDWKAQRIFDTLDWKGSLWVEEKTGLTAEFPEPGRFRWLVFPEEELERYLYTRSAVNKLRALESRLFPIGNAQITTFRDTALKPEVAPDGIGGITLSTDGDKLFLFLPMGPIDPFAARIPQFTFSRQPRPPSDPPR